MDYLHVLQMLLHHPETAEHFDPRVKQNLRGTCWTLRDIIPSQWVRTNILFFLTEAKEEHETARRRARPMKTRGTYEVYFKIIDRNGATARRKIDFANAAMTLVLDCWATRNAWMYHHLFGGSPITSEIIEVSMYCKPLPRMVKVYRVTPREAFLRINQRWIYHVLTEFQGGGLFLPNGEFRVYGGYQEQEPQ